MSDPIRLPVSHRQKPHCVECGADLSRLTEVEVSVPVGLEFEVLGVSFAVRCKCGATWSATKRVKR